MRLTRRLQKTNKDQFILTIPKSIAQILNWYDKSIVEFGFERGKIVLNKAKNKTSKLSRRLQKTNKDQFILTIPKNLVQILEWKNKDFIEFGFERGKISISKQKGKKGEKSE